MRVVPEGEIRARIEALQARLSARGLRGALLNGRVDRFYLSGTAQEGLLWVGCDGDPRLFVLRDVARAKEETPFEVIPVAGWRGLWGRAREVAAAGGVGLTLDALTALDLLRLDLHDPAAAHDVTPDLLALRARKSPWEVERMEEAGRVAADVYRLAAHVLRPGLTEAQFAGQLFARAMELGHEGILRTRGGFEAYSWHVLSGPNTRKAGAVDTPMSGEGLSPAFPWGAGRRVIGQGEPVIVDFGVSVFGYATDQTRTFCIGSAPQWLLDAHGAVLEVHRRMAESLVAGVAAGEVFTRGEEEAHALGLSGYLGPPESRCRFVGHGVGLEVVEPPLIVAGSTSMVGASSTVALEPKAVVGDLGGVGVEDTFLVGPEGARPLSGIPLELIRV